MKKKTKLVKFNQTFHGVTDSHSLYFLSLHFHIYFVSGSRRPAPLPCFSNSKEFHIQFENPGKNTNSNFICTFFFFVKEKAILVHPFS